MSWLYCQYCLSSRDHSRNLYYGKYSCTMYVSFLKIGTYTHKNVCRVIRTELKDSQKEKTRRIFVNYLLKFAIKCGFRETLYLHQVNFEINTVTQYFQRTKFIHL